MRIPATYLITRQVEITTKDKLLKLNLEQLQNDIDQAQSMADHYQNLADRCQLLLDLAKDARKSQ